MYVSFKFSDTEENTNLKSKFLARICEKSALKIIQVSEVIDSKW